jgi:hypothetical protein
MGANCQHPNILEIQSLITMLAPGSVLESVSAFESLTLIRAAIKKYIEWRL